MSGNREKEQSLKICREAYHEEKQKNRLPQTHGGDIYSHPGILDFSANINPFGASEAVKAAAMRGICEAEHYPDPKCRGLREALSRKIGISPDWFAFGNGAADLIFSSVLAEKPKKAVLTAPCFSEYAQALSAAGCKIDYVYLRAENEFELTENYIENLTADTDLVFLCSPDNPAGRVIEKELFEKILRRCEKYRIRVILDECFYEFLEPGDRRGELSLLKKYPLLVMLRAFTKMHGIPGLRLGYLISSDEMFLKRLALVRQPWSVSSAAAYAGIAALSEEERVVMTRNYVAAERHFLEQELEKLGISYVPSQANYILFYSSYDLYTLLLEQNILIRDCRNYEGLEAGYYRIAVRTREENKVLIDALRQIKNKADNRME